MRRTFNMVVIFINARNKKQCNIFTGLEFVQVNYLITHTYKDNKPKFIINDDFGEFQEISKKVKSECEEVYVTSTLTTDRIQKILDHESNL